MYNVVLITKLLFFTEIFLSEILMIFDDIEIILKVQFWHFLTRPSSKDLQKKWFVFWLSVTHGLFDNESLIYFKVCILWEGHKILQNIYSSITLTFINDYLLNIDDIKEFWSFGLCWPSWPIYPFRPWMNQNFKQKLIIFGKN